MGEIRWTPLMVEKRLVEAADVMRRLPEVRVPGHFNTWPKTLHEFADLVGQEPPRLKRPPPSSDAIGRMEQALTWLSWLEPMDRKLVWMRASGERWKTVCWTVGACSHCCAPALGLCPLPDCLQTERRCAGAALTATCDRIGAGREDLSTGAKSVREHFSTGQKRCRSATFSPG